MITIISGSIDSGKTTMLAKHFSGHGQGDGFIALKFFKEGQVQGYLSQKLSTQETLPWLIRDINGTHPFQHASHIGPYSANLDSLKAMEKAYETMMKQGTSPIYVDEIGEWELTGQGFDSIFRKMLSSHCNLVIAVRKELLTRVIDHYGLKEYVVLWSSK